MTPHLAFQYLRIDVDSGLSRNEKWRRRTVKESVCLTVGIRLLDAVAQLLKIELCLDVHVLPAFDRVRRPGPELLLGPLPCDLTPPVLLHPLDFHRVRLNRLE